MNHGLVYKKTRANFRPIWLPAHLFVRVTTSFPRFSTPCFPSRRGALKICYYLPMFWRLAAPVCMAFITSVSAQTSSGSGTEDQCQWTRATHALSRSRVEPAYPTTTCSTWGSTDLRLQANSILGKPRIANLTCSSPLRRDVASRRLFDGNVGICAGAEEAVQKWKFDPAVVSGRPVIVLTKLTVPVRVSISDPSGKSFGMDDIIETIRAPIAKVVQGQPEPSLCPQTAILQGPFGPHVHCWL